MITAAEVVELESLRKKMKRLSDLAGCYEILADIFEDTLDEEEVEDLLRSAKNIRYILETDREDD